MRFLKLRRIHFVGAGGVGMSGLAEILLLGDVVSIGDPTGRDQARRYEELRPAQALHAHGQDHRLAGALRLGHHPVEV